MQLADVCELIVDCPHSTAKDEGVGYPLIRTPNIGPGYLNLRNVHRVSRRVYEQRNARATPKAGDVILAREAPAGNAGIVLENQEVCLGQRTVLIRPDRSLVNPWFLNYYLNAPKQRQMLLNAANGATVPHVNMLTIRSLPVSFPPLHEQERIAGILRSYDDLIRMNNTTNDYLSELAQAVFVHWVDQHAKGREIASLTEEGGYYTLDELCSRITDGAYRSPKADPNGAYPMFSVKDMRRYGFSYSSCKRISRTDYDAMVFNDCVPKVDDILVAKDGSYLKEVFIIDRQREEAVLSSIAIFRPNNKMIAPELLLQYLKHPRVLKLVSDNFVSGSALPRIVLKDFKKLSLLVPNRAEQDGILPMLQAIRRLTRINEDETAKLESLRDALLPKLMSGEIDAVNPKLD